MEIQKGMPKRILKRRLTNSSIKSLTLLEYLSRDNGSKAMKSSHKRGGKAKWDGLQRSTCRNLKFFFINLIKLSLGEK